MLSLFTDRRANEDDTLPDGTDCDCVLALQINITQPSGKSLDWKYRYAWDLRQVQACEQIQNFCP
jgi:hypothetical protein